MGTNTKHINNLREMFKQMKARSKQKAGLQKPITPSEYYDEDWAKLDHAMQTGSVEDIIKFKASKLRTYAKLKYDVVFQVGKTKHEIAAKIIELRKEG